MNRLNIVIMQLAEMKLQGMAMSRSTWVDRVHFTLRGALREYTKVRLARLAGIPASHWESEIQGLMRKVRTLFDAETLATKTKFDRSKAFKEAIMDASTSQDQIVEAKNLFLGYPDVVKKGMKIHHTLRSTHFDATVLLQEMIEEYLWV